MIYGKLKKYVPEKIWLAWAGIILAVVSAALQVAGYYYLYQFLSEILYRTDMTAAVSLAMRILAFLIAGVIVYFLALLATHVLGFRLETNLKKEGIKHLMGASFSFFDKNESGRIRKIIDDNTVLTHTSVAHYIPDLTTALFLPVLGIPLTFFIDYRLGILFIASYVGGFLMIRKMQGETQFMGLYMNALEKMNSGAVEYVRGMQILKIFGANAESLKDFHTSITDYSDMALRYSMSCRRWWVIMQVVLNSIFLAAMFFGYTGNLTPWSYLAKFLFYVLFNGIIFISLNKVMRVGMNSYLASSAIGKIETLLSEMDEKKLENGTLEKMDSFSIEFDNVSFGYTGTEIFNGLSFSLEQGKTYALVGPSGSGKSTLAKLVSGFYVLDGGRILVGGRDISQYSQKALAANIANVFQDVRLFKKTIFENVSLGRSNCTRGEVMQALHLAQCDEILDKLPYRENTIIGAKGVHLSGGEVQRIAIARAIVKNAGIVILDEASAAADPENEYELQKALSNLMKGKTVIMIAHRLSSIKNVDEVLVMDNGMIVERGSHSALMKKDSAYRKMQEDFTNANEWRVRK